MTARRSYWSRYTRKRISRRRALQLAAIGGAGIAVAAACGDGDGGDGEPPEGTGTPSAQGGPGQVIDPQPVTDMEPGGIYRNAFTGDPFSLDPQVNISFTTDLFVSGWAYSRLYKYKVEPGYDPTLFDQVPDVAESHEISDDGLTWTFTLRPDVKFHNKPPLDGRALDSEDVVATYRRFMGLTDSPPARYEIVLRRTIDSVEAPDDRTVVFHLKFPYAAFLNQVAAATYLWIMSKEAVAGDIDPTTVEGVIGTGPWELTEFTPSQSMRYRRHPEWHEAPLPYLDGYNVAIVPEYVTRQAQFLAGNLDGEGVNANDLIDVVSNTPGAQVNASAFLSVLNFMFFDHGINPESPFKDENVRRAVSMAMDRDALLEALYNLSVVRDAGYLVESRWHNALPSGLSRTWLDPQGEEMGDAAQWYEYNPERAKVLLEEAGFADGFSSAVHSAVAIYGSAYDQGAEAIIPFLREIGIDTDTKQDDYANWITNIFSGNEIDGMAYALETVFSEADEYLHAMYHPEGVRNHSRIDDPELTQMIDDQAIEKDIDRRIELVHEIQRYVSDKMYYVPLVVYGAQTFSVTHPWVRNVGVYNAASFGGPTEGGATHVGFTADAPGRDIEG